MAETADVVLTVDHRRRAHLAGRPLVSGSMADLLDHLELRLPASATLTAVTPNTDFTVLMRSDARMARAVQDADLLLADGAPLVWLARLLGARDLHRLTGADLLPETCARAARTGWRIVLTGGRDGVAQLAAEHLREQSGADVVALPFPLLDGHDDPAGRSVVDALREARPDIVFVCLGAPKQEAWVEHWRDDLPPALYVGAGAAVDFAAGLRSRAPRAVQAIGAEWLYRLAQEPSRLAGRYLLRGPLFLGVVARSLAQAARGRPVARADRSASAYRPRERRAPLPARISVVIPTHDRDEQVEDAIASVLAQTLPAHEVLVCDDLGSATTRTVVARWTDRTDGLVRYVDSSGPAAGTAGASRNVGAALASAPLLAFLDDDDTWLPEHLERLHLSLSRDDADLAVAWTAADDPTFVFARMTSGLRVPDVVSRNPGFVGSNFLVRTDVLQAVRGFDPALRVANDQDLLVRLLRSGARYCVVPRVTVRNRIHAGGQLTDKTERRAQGVLAYRRKHRDLLGLRDQVVIGTIVAGIRRVSAPRALDRVAWTAATAAGRAALLVSRPRRASGRRPVPPPLQPALPATEVLAGAL
ncbi:WecB/TagA/CpsF family glycosyltransferase [Cellulomonas sp. S1-8]|uniref:WecB/TagA/CpsF family glycosyltransferase n=1 Tax=Cellulomonas sp. S1-8 TaxID=2904790 RepID=UPI002243001C|nr:WecB/TagA/CpsF family glycosyltransferase [Cellulomonas sp. S1-8]UZN04303.1 WecB/TagA/CpsF family glycosyltransferase [Cellulomonas sp. S1-8]